MFRRYRRVISLALLLFVLPVSWIGCSFEATPRRAAAPTHPTPTAVHVIGDPGGGGEIQPAPTCPRPLYGEAEWTRTSTVDLLRGLGSLIGEHPSALSGGHAAKYRQLALIDRALVAGDDLGARRALAGLAGEIKREAAANRVETKFWLNIQRRLDGLLTLPDLPERTIDVTGRSLLLAAAGDSSCWRDCMNQRAHELGDQLIDCLGLDSLEHAISELIKACLAGVITETILTGGLGTIPGAIAGCLIGIDIDLHLCVGEFVCKLAWAGIKCWWNC